MSLKFAMTAMILAGGKSARMGQDKALLHFGKKTLLEHLIELVSPFFDETLVVVNVTAKLEGLKLSQAVVCEDLIKGRGPLAGIYTGLTYSRSEASCVLTCDMPFIDEDILLQLVDLWKEKEDPDVICFRDPNEDDQPFPGIYRRGSRTLMGSLLARGEGSMRKYLQVARVKTQALNGERLRVLENMNTPEDYHRALQGMKRIGKGAGV